jgi:ribosome biogenesis GTPase
MYGKITKGVGGFYTVLTTDGKYITCSVKGIFRKQNITPTIGDNVVLEQVDKHFVIAKILSRKNVLARPTVANISQAILVAACTKPEPNLMVLDKLTAICEAKELNIIICFNKTDLASDEKIHILKEIYKKTPYKILFTSANKKNIFNLQQLLQDHITVFAGPSGVGKSTLINAVNPSFYLNTGDISEKIGRGKHTTRHTELLVLNETSYIVDTPGFANVDINEIKFKKIKHCFAEFEQYNGLCQFASCMHDSEPNCAVKNALADGYISSSRYENYIAIKNEILLNTRNYKK